MLTTRQIQERLSAHGYNPGKIDGVMGPKTETAIIQFKIARGLRARSFVGGVTRELLSREPALKATKSQVKKLAGTVPPLAKPFLRMLGWHEVRNKNSLIAWFKSFGKYLGDPSRLPWCAEAAENASLEMFPHVPVPDNPFWAWNWRWWGTRVDGPVIGAWASLRWKRGGGHIGNIAQIDWKGRRLLLLGGNQGNQIKYSWFRLDDPKIKEWSFNVAPTEVGKVYAPYGPGTVASNGGFADTR